jgi:hypothetical protein
VKRSLQTGFKQPQLAGYLIGYLTNRAPADCIGKQLVVRKYSGPSGNLEIGKTCPQRGFLVACLVEIRLNHSFSLLYFL